MLRQGIAVLCLGVIVHSSISAYASEDSDYFRQFIYKKEVIATDPDFPTTQYRYLMTKNPTEYQSDNGSKVTVMSTLYLNDSGTYDLYYHEWATGNETEPYKLCRHLKGNWSVPATDLILEGQATGKRLFMDSQNAAQITFSQNLIRPGLKGRPLAFIYGYSNQGIDTEFCF